MPSMNKPAIFLMFDGALVHRNLARSETRRDRARARDHRRPPLLFAQLAFERLLRGVIACDRIVVDAGVPQFCSFIVLYL